MATAPLAGPATPLFNLQDAHIDRYLSTPAPPQRWVFDGFLPLGIVAALVSPGDMGKSQYLMQMAYSVATGIPLASHWKVGEQGSVLMLCAEDDENEIHRRIKKIHAQLGGALPKAKLVELQGRLLVKSLVAEEVQLTTVHEGNEAVRTDVVERLLLVAKQLPDLKLIIIDPASRFRGGDENSNAHATRFVQAAESLAKETGATMLMAHHSSKAGAFSQEASQHASRGASALTDGIRLQLALNGISAKAFKGPAEERLKYLELSVVKTNYTAPQEPISLLREDDGYLRAVVAPPSHSAPDGVLLVHLLEQIDKPPRGLTARAIEMNLCGEKKAIKTTQKKCRHLLTQARQSGWISGAKGKPLMLTPNGAQHLKDNLAAAQSTAAGAARQRRTPAKVVMNQ